MNGLVVYKVHIAMRIGLIIVYMGKGAGISILNQFTTQNQIDMCGMTASNT